VLVNGQVNNPSAVTFTPGKNAGWYLERAGGTTEFGNHKGIFVIRADGSVVGAKGASSWFSGNVLSTVMQPGDTVVVPDKIITENLFWKNILNTAQITSSLAIAARVATSF
jgi:protein involved in polysaccharide export with SLBB domain